MKSITISELQRYIKEKDHHPDLKKDYFLKLSEEVGELAKAPSSRYERLHDLVLPQISVFLTKLLHEKTTN